MKMEVSNSSASASILSSHVSSGHHDSISGLTSTKFYFNWPKKTILQTTIQVSLAIRGGYIPDKFQTGNTKTGSLSLN